MYQAPRPTLCDACPCRDMGHCIGQTFESFCRAAASDQAGRWADSTRRRTLGMPAPSHAPEEVSLAAVFPLSVPHQARPAPSDPSAKPPGSSQGDWEKIRVLRTATPDAIRQGESCGFRAKAETCCDSDALRCTAPGLPTTNHVIHASDCTYCVLTGQQPEGMIHDSARA